MTPQDIHHFWFETLSPEDWFAQNPKLDRRIAASFGPLVLAAPSGMLAAWRTSAVGRLAEILVLDQFPRNIYRDRAEAYHGDALALQMAKQAIAADAPRELPAVERAFVYMPFMHSESLAEHERALELFSEPGLENQLKHERRHRAILERFGRYPQRNAALGRESTAEEAAFLAEPGSGF
ncbi:DUF924 family protein [Salinisphaera sp. SPP-AMP-43]|uniref:DUF924 family protein n=1 Tax=Salinisphaera sp. SPP-AMP-43 TaxID=3121288 RepID=UPI003C6DC7A8